MFRRRLDKLKAIVGSGLPAPIRCVEEVAREGLVENSDSLSGD